MNVRVTLSEDSDGVVGSDSSQGAHLWTAVVWDRREGKRALFSAAVWQTWCKQKKKDEKTKKNKLTMMMLHNKINAELMTEAITAI